MARRDVIEVTCDRCKRKETQCSTDMPTGGSPEVDATFHGERITFNDLCKRCREAVGGYFGRLAKKVDDQTSMASLDEKDGRKKSTGFLGNK
jgi:hypothetical protein